MCAGAHFSIYAKCQREMNFYFRVANRVRGNLAVMRLGLISPKNSVAFGT
jgi:hypothetical protein